MVDEKRAWDAVLMQSVRHLNCVKVKSVVLGWRRWVDRGLQHRLALRRAAHRLAHRSLAAAYAAWYDSAASGRRLKHLAKRAVQSSAHRRLVRAWDLWIVLLEAGHASRSAEKEAYALAALKWEESRDADIAELARSHALVLEDLRGEHATAERARELATAEIVLLLG